MPYLNYFCPCCCQDIWYCYNCSCTCPQVHVFKHFCKMHNDSTPGLQGMKIILLIEKIKLLTEDTVSIFTSTNYIQKLVALRQCQQWSDFYVFYQGFRDVLQFSVLNIEKVEYFQRLYDIPLYCEISIYYLWNVCAFQIFPTEYYNLLNSLDLIAVRHVMKCFLPIFRILFCF